MCMKQRWTTLLWELWAAQAVCTAAAFPPGNPFIRSPAAVPAAWAAWGLLAQPPEPLPPEQLLEAPPGFDLATLCDFEAAAPG